MFTAWALGSEGLVTAAGVGLGTLSTTGNGRCRLSNMALASGVTDVAPESPAGLLVLDAASFVVVVAGVLAGCERLAGKSSSWRRLISTGLEACPPTGAEADAADVGTG